MKPLDGGASSSHYGIGLKLLSVMCMTMMAACIKRLDGQVPAGEVVVFRSLCAVLLLLAFAGAQHQLAATVRTVSLRGHLVRGMSGAGGIFFNLMALAYLPLTEAITLTYAIPLLTLALATLRRHEQVARARWMGAGVGFLGVLIVVSPRLGLGGSAVSAGTLTGMGFGLLGACCSAFSTLHIRRMSATEHPYAIVFYFSLVTGAFGLLGSVTHWVQPSATQLALLLAGGTFGGLGQLLFVQSLKHAHASLVAPFEYTSLVWAMLLSYLVFGDAPTAVMIAGALVIAGSGLYTTWSAR